MIDEKLLVQISRAAELLSCGISGRIHDEGTYMELLREYKNSSTFQRIIKNIAQGLKVEILAVEHHGVYLKPDPESIFAPNRQVFAKLTHRANWDKHVGLVIVAVAAMCFGHQSRFEDEVSAMRVITIEEIDEYIRERCKALKKKYQPDDIPVGQSELELLLISYGKLPRKEHGESKIRTNSETIIKQVMDFLVKQKFFISKEGQYWSTPKFRYNLESLVKDQRIKELLEITAV